MCVNDSIRICMFVCMYLKDFLSMYVFICTEYMAQHIFFVHLLHFYWCYTSICSVSYLRFFNSHVNVSNALTDGEKKWNAFATHAATFERVTSHMHVGEHLSGSVCYYVGLLHIRKMKTFKRTQAIQNIGLPNVPYERFFVRRHTFSIFKLILLQMEFIFCI